MKKKSFLLKKWRRVFVAVYGLLFILQMSSLGLAPVLTLEAEATTITWDRSSLQFKATYLVDCEKISIQVCNYGDRDMAGTTNYDVWYKATGNPIDGAKVAGGTIPALSKGQCFSIEYSATAVGNYKFKAYQRPGHPGSGYTWSPIMNVGDLECPEPVCGDGIINQTSEECDDGNQDNTDGCLNDCTLAACGDGYLWAGQELCDDNGNNGVPCVPSYGGQCSYCSGVCQPVNLTGPYCGDGLVNGSEECDGQAGVGEHQTCNPDCTLTGLTYCGDGVRQSPNTTGTGGPAGNGYEDCDGTDGVPANYSCSQNCTLIYLPYCGDGNIDNGELCDNGALNGQVCTPPYGGQCSYCSGVCQPVNLTGPYCGDSLVNGAEQCDDGNTNNDDECKNDCTLAECEFALDVMMVMDRSGSMGYDSPTRLSRAKIAANSFLADLNTTDQSGLVSFATTASVNKTLSNSHSQTQTAISSLTAVGATNIGDAIKLANQELISIRHNPLAVPIEILLTDGMANKPNGPGYGEYAADVAYAKAKADEAASAGIKIFTIGLGSNVNTSMLQYIASATGGQYYFAPTAAELQGIYDQIGYDVCEPTICGDGVKNGDEQCDGTDGVGAHQSCSGACTLNNLPYCGDGIKNGTEECDGIDGVGVNQTCGQTCALTDLPFCGDGIVNGTEECDDANQIDTDECKNDCARPSICGNSLDIALVMDRSGSMGYTSTCDWWQLKCVNPPSCSSGYNWVKNTTYNQTQSWCNAKNQSAPHNSVWTEYNPVKITAAKATANNFLDLLGVGDQSALVSFANNATLDKQLSNNHATTQATVNSLITNGATDIGDAIKLAAGELTSTRINPAASQVMILLTDGMANKPYGPGYGEYPADVAYALAKAGEAATAGIKIFTIGLGNDINATMLQQIATLSGGQYYFAPTAGQLQEIFDQITVEFCVQIAYGHNAAGDYGRLFAKNEPSAKLEPFNKLLIACV